MAHSRTRIGIFATYSAALLSLSVFTPYANAACTAGNTLSTIPESTPSSDFTDVGNGTVIQHSTGLIWKQCAEGQNFPGCTGTATTHTWQAAHSLAQTDNTASKSDWRLPNFKELQSIVEHCWHSPAINQTIFPNTPSDVFWASTPNFENGIPNAWSVNFAQGQAVATTPKSNTHHVRLVRDGLNKTEFDTLAPEIDEFAAKNITNTSATLSFGFDIDANYYIIIVNQGNVAPTAEEVIAGVNYNAGAAIVLNNIITRSGFLDSIDTETFIFTDASATPSKTYDAYLVALNSIQNAYTLVQHLPFKTYEDPDAFSILPQIDVALETKIVSEQITITFPGVGTGSDRAKISITNGEYSIDGGTYTSANGEINHNQKFTVRHTSATTNNRTVETTVTIGNQTAIFRTTTAKDSTPDNFYFSDLIGGAFNQQIISNEVVIKDFSIPLPISVIGGEYSINGSAFTNIDGTINSGDSVAVRLLSASSGGITREATLTVGTISDTFSVTTDIDTDGDGLSNLVDSDDDNDGVRDEDDLNPLDASIGAATNQHNQGGGSLGGMTLLALLIALRRRLSI